MSRLSRPAGGAGHGSSIAWVFFLFLFLGCSILLFLIASCFIDILLCVCVFIFVIFVFLIYIYINSKYIKPCLPGIPGKGGARYRRARSKHLVVHVIILVGWATCLKQR